MTLQEQLMLVRNNPVEAHRLALQFVRKATNGELEVGNPGNPLILGLEAAAHLGAMACNSSEAIHRYLYSEMADNPADLYRHMSDADYVGRFATPSRAPFQVVLGLDDIQRLAVATGEGDVRKITIPKHAQIEVGGVKFTQQYPLDIRVLPRGGLQLAYDVSDESPLYGLESNVVEYKIANLERVEAGGGECVVIDYPLYQFEIASQTFTLGAGGQVSHEYSFSDQFYHCRVYQADDGVKWKECATTHSEQTYDPSILTVLLRVEGNRLRVTTPNIYFTNGLARGSMRVDIYSTRGKLDMMLDSYDVQNFQANWNDLDNTDQGRYTTPLSSFQKIMVLSQGAAVGGSNGLTFEGLRTRQQLNAGKGRTAITDAQLEYQMQSRGYSIQEVIDDLPNRVYLGIRGLPKPEGSDFLNAGANCAVLSTKLTFEEIVLLDSVYDHKTRVTILPSTLWRLNDGVVVPVTGSELAKVTDPKASKELIANLVNARDYLYSPFHYVLDANGRTFDARGYELSMPSVVNRGFKEENSSVLIGVGSSAFAVDYLADVGYVLHVSVVSDDTYKTLPDSEVWCQLAYVPAGESTYAYLNGVLEGMIDGERVWKFTLGSSFDVNTSDELILNTFRMFNNPANDTRTLLEEGFELFHGIVASETAKYEPAAMDAVIGAQFLPARARGVTHELITVRFGEALTKLWANARTVVGPQDYQRWSENVPKVWPETQFERESNGSMKFYLQPDGSYQPKVTHEKGSPVLLDDGSPVWEYQVGEIKRDPVTKEPLIAEPRRLQRYVDMFYIEGAYRFSTNPLDVAYRNSVASTLIEFLNKDITPTSKELLEGTELYFLPRKTLGNITVLVDDQMTRTLPANLSWNVKFYLSRVNYENQSYRDGLAKIAKQVINEQLTKASVSLSEMNDVIRSKLGNDPVPVDIAGVGSDGKLTTWILNDQTERTGVRRKLVVLADETTRVEDDITVEFVVNRA